MQPAHRGPLCPMAPGVVSHPSRGNGCPMAMPSTRAGDPAEPQTCRRHCCCLAGGLRTRDLLAAAPHHHPMSHSTKQRAASKCQEHPPAPSASC